MTEIKKPGSISRRGFLKFTGSAAVAGALIPMLPSSGKEAAHLGAETAEEERRGKWVQRQASANPKFDKLFSPGKIGKLTIKNRIVKSAAGSVAVYDETTNTYSPETVTYYDAVAKGGAGLVIVDNPAWTQAPNGRPFWDDQFIPAEKTIVDAIHKYNVPAFIQFYSMVNFFGNPAMAASPVNFPSTLDFNNPVPKEMTLDDIHQIQAGLVDATVRAQKSGYDGVEINAGCSHLFSSFLSRFLNKRKDQYGPQSIENQARIINEMIQQIKLKCGSDFPVSVLINGYEINLLEVGNNGYCTTTEESAAIAKELEKGGADLIHVRSGTFGDHPKSFFPELFYLTGEANSSYGYEIDLEKHWPEYVRQFNGSAAFVDIAAKVKQAVSIPVMTVGAVDPRLLPDYVEDAIEKGKIDFVALTRPLLADPELPNKLAAGKINDVRPCTHCYTCFKGGSGFCRVNAAYGRAAGKDMPEGYDVSQASTKKKVMVIGGGPAGMEAARVAALRGHQVTLYEKSRRLGGLLPLASMVKGQHEKILDFLSYLSTQLSELGVSVKFGQTVDAALVQREKPDAVIVATGAAYATPKIPGINHPKVITNDALHQQLEMALSFTDPATLRWLTNFYLPVEKDAVILGGQIQGVQVAELLVQRGKNVVILEEGPIENLGNGMPDTSRQRLIYYLQTHGVKILTDVKYDEINDEGVAVTLQNGLQTTVKAGSVILALPLVANPGLLDSVKGVVNEAYAVGDCSLPGVIETSITSANLTARKI